jgi:hypothetical protein
LELAKAEPPPDTPSILEEYEIKKQDLKNLEDLELKICSEIKELEDKLDREETSRQ